MNAPQAHIANDMEQKSICETLPAKRFDASSRVCLCMCMYVCVYVYMSIYVCHAYACVYVCMCIDACICLSCNACMLLQALAFRHNLLSKEKWNSPKNFTRWQVCVYVCVCVSLVPSHTC
ncbi:hypothetical protein LOAG_09300 [Loa loa]|uniref:Uncharacterized protein n=1 Tax=Loa loa TaxID=7209 RepID=A0A1S0TSQ5_LOALO|nr:hypothetical protein LOAG_09300 [Loa loa]EFO19193.1 hypothetical protein LOAG_09300 [Loa loa]